MKLLLSIATLLIAFGLMAQHESSFTTHYNYTIPISAKANAALRKGPCTNLDSTTHKRLVTSILDIVRSKKVQLYSAVVDEYEDYAPDKTYKIAIPPVEYDSLLMEIYLAPRFDDNGNATHWDTFGSAYHIEDYVSITFNEVWSYSYLHLNVKVLGLSLNVHSYSDEGDIDGYKGLFYLPLNQAQSGRKTKRLVQNSIVSTVTIDDVNAEYVSPLWWVNQLEISKRYTLFEPILENSRSNKLTVFQPSYPYTVPLSKAEAIDKNQFAITEPELDDEGHEIYHPSGDISMVTDTIELIYYDIGSVSIMADWYFDPENLIFEKDVKGVIPNEVMFDENDNYIGNQPLYFVPFSGK
jgi:hypothetical protein